MSPRSSLIAALSLPCLACAVQGQLVFSDNFESGSFGSWATPVGETTGASIVSGGISGSSFANVNGSTSADVLGHGLGTGNGLSDWALEFDFKLEVAGATGRYFNVHIGAAATTGTGVATDSGSAAINLRYQQDSDSEGFDVYNGSSWTPLRTGLGIVDREEWYHLKIEGFGWGTPNFTYTITLTPSDEAARTVSGLKLFQNGNPGSALMDGFNFNRGFGFPTGKNFGVDNVVLTGVPEPSTVAALLFGVGLLGFRRRRLA